MPSSARGRVWAPAPTAQGAPHLRGPRANPAKRFAWGKGGPAAGMSVRARPEASDPKLGLTLSRCGGCATPHCLPLREKHLAPAAQLLFRLRGSLCGCSARLRASCHAAGWAHGRVAKRPFREKCRRASPGLFFRLHVLLAPLCAYPPRFSVTLRLLRDATLLTPPRKTPCACGATAFSSAGCAVRLLRPPPRFCVGAALVAARPKPGTGRKEAGGDKSRPYG